MANKDEYIRRRNMCVCIEGAHIITANHRNALKKQQ